MLSTGSRVAGPVAMMLYSLWHYYCRREFGQDKTAAMPSTFLDSCGVPDTPAQLTERASVASILFKLQGLRLLWWGERNQFGLSPDVLRHTRVSTNRLSAGFQQTLPFLSSLIFYSYSSSRRIQYTISHPSTPSSPAPTLDSPLSLSPAALAASLCAPLSCGQTSLALTAAVCSACDGRGVSISPSTALPLSIPRILPV
jgi:hypothetical protein